MIRKHESDVSWKAGFLAFAVHGVLFIAMVVSIDWKAAHPPLNVTEVELWDQLPNKNAHKPIETPPKPAEPPKPVEPPKPLPQEEPKPEPKPVPEEKPEPAPPKVDIELEQKKKAAEQKKLAEEKKKAEIEKIKKEMREEELRQEKIAETKKKDALKKLQQELLSDERPAGAQQASNVSPSVISEFTEKIKAKIRGNVNKSLCGEGNPELRFEIGVLPTGELSGTPKLVKSSGNAICDEAVERAIMASEPFPLPEDNAAKAKFRNLNLKFKPNAE